MNFTTWSASGIRQKKDIIASDMERLGLDKLKVLVPPLMESIYIYTLAFQNLIKETLKNKIADWESIDENIWKMDIKIYGHNMTVIAAYPPSNDKRINLK